MSEQGFGGLIRRQRERLGLSVNRVAELVGRAPSTVRSWERGRSVPSDVGLLSTVAAVLAIPQSTLLAAAGLDTPTKEHAPTIEQSLAEIAPGREDEPTDSSTDVDEPHLPGIDVTPSGAGLPLRGGRTRARHTRTPVEAEETPVPVITVPPPTPPARHRSYMEDPGQRLLYRLRGVFTLIGLFVTFVILAWAGGNLLSALGEFWDALFGGL